MRCQRAKILYTFVTICYNGGAGQGTLPAWDDNPAEDN